MHKILSTSLLLALSSVSLNAVSDQDREAMCHKGQNFEFVEPSVQAHLNHGDKMGTCEGAGPGDMDGMTAVLIMRCKADEIVSFSASFDYASIQPVEPITCPEALSSALAAGLKLRSITSGSADDSEGLQMYTDYLLLGEEPEED
jgi:hypothetical protein